MAPGYTRVRKKTMDGTGSLGCRSPAGVGKPLKQVLTEIEGINRVRSVGWRTCRHKDTYEMSLLPLEVAEGWRIIGCCEKDLTAARAKCGRDDLRGVQTLK